MTVDPFIEAEEIEGHSVINAIGLLSVINASRLLEVSRVAYFQRLKAEPSMKDLGRAQAAAIKSDG